MKVMEQGRMTREEIEQKTSLMVLYASWEAKNGKDE